MINPLRSWNAQPRASFRPTLEILEDRRVPATLLDLTTAGATGTIGDAVFQQTDQQPTGSGVMNSFLRVQAKNHLTVEHGYNTDARKLDLDQKAGAHTRSLTLGEVPQVEINGVRYREFLLDINQTGTSPKLSLDELRLYVGAAADVQGYNASTRQLAGLDPIYDLDAGGDHYILLDYRLASGSGSGDMFFYVPESAFAGVSSTSYVNLYCKFGVHAGANSGFEEWGVRELPPLPPPPPPTGSISGFVFVDLNEDGVRDDGEGLAGVMVTLTGNNGVTMTAITNGDGSYSFTGLPVGTYAVSETQPDGYLDGTDYLGTVNGNMLGTDTGADMLTNIELLAGEHGIDFNFSELSKSSGGGG